MNNYYLWTFVGDLGNTSFVDRNFSITDDQHLTTASSSSSTSSIPSPIYHSSYYRHPRSLNQNNHENRSTTVPESKTRPNSIPRFLSKTDDLTSITLIDGENSAINSVSKRRRYASEEPPSMTTASLVNTFLQYLRDGLRSTSPKNVHQRVNQSRSRTPSTDSGSPSDNRLSSTFNLSTHFYRHQYPAIYTKSLRMVFQSPNSTSTSTHRLNNDSVLSNDNALINTSIPSTPITSDQDILDSEILTLVDLLVLRVACLSESSDEIPRPTVAEVDQNLIEYLYYLFTKFIVTADTSVSDANSTDESLIDKKSFIQICQTLVKNGCFDMSSVSVSPTTSQSTEDTVLEYVNNDQNKNDLSTATITDEKQNETATEENTWLMVDISESELSKDENDVSSLNSSVNTNEQLLMCAKNNIQALEVQSYVESITTLSNVDVENDSTTNNGDAAVANYLTLEEIQNCCEFPDLDKQSEESSKSIYLSPNSSIVDIVQEFDDAQLNILQNNDNEGTHLDISLFLVIIRI
ncbi:unnamed protein product [Didymodactylos carnosus]|uniref:Uncharacterized protein n=1 Tax=Didymodactylos carnosus TaxID=1234261 RepID=A0A813S9J5_9BILA|nr:unnamed protein product [Didymodactylos carnosus]CAF3581881.1 unnamed protein product [Didymodactylos carnosus]